jgi:hypothetical protein
MPDAHNCGLIIELDTVRHEQLLLMLPYDRKVTGLRLAPLLRRMHLVRLKMKLNPASI